jgi:cobalamin biosynthesis protein CobD/CbiB
MAMAAGLIGVRLDKRGHYALGEGLRAPDAVALAQAEALTKVTGWLACALFLFMLASLGGSIVD